MSPTLKALEAAGGDKTEEVPSLERVEKNKEKFLDSMIKEYGLDRTIGAIEQVLEIQESLQRDTRLSETFLLGTHNSYNSTAYGVPSITAEQNLKIEEQLDLGVRFLMIDVKDCNGVLYTAHKYCTSLTKSEALSVILDEIVAWKKKHPERTLLIDFENNNDASTDKEFVAMVKDKFGTLLFPPKSYVNLPTLGDVHGKVLPFIEKFRDTKEKNKVFYGIFFRYGLQSEKLGSVASEPKLNEYTFFPLYPDNLISKFRKLHAPEKFFKNPKRNGLIIMYEGTNLDTVVYTPNRISTLDIEKAKFSGVNVLSLDSIQDKKDGVKKMFAALWAYAPSFSKHGSSQCTYIDHNTLLWMRSACLDKKDATIACHIEDGSDGSWVLTKSRYIDSQSGERACNKVGAHFKSPRSPSQVMDILDLSAEEIDIAINGDELFMPSKDGEPL